MLRKPFVLIGDGTVPGRSSMLVMIGLVAILYTSGCAMTSGPGNRLAKLVVVAPPHENTDFRYEGTNVVVRRDGNRVTLEKHGGPSSMEVLIDWRLDHDFRAELKVRIASLHEMGEEYRGGTPVPYFGFLSVDGKTKCPVLLPTLVQDSKVIDLVIVREAGALNWKDSESKRWELEPWENMTMPGYLFFTVNDRATLEILELALLDLETGKHLLFNRVESDLEKLESWDLNRDGVPNSMSQINQRDRMIDPTVPDDAVDSDKDGMPDWWEIKYGLNHTNAADKFQDADDDGLCNFLEFKAGGDPSPR